MTSSFLAPRTTAGYLLAGALFTCAGLIATPWESEQTTRAYLDAMAGNPTRGQVSAILLHLGYMLLAAGAFGILARLGRDGGWPMRIGGVLTILGATTMPGLLIVDSYDMVIAQELPRDVGVRVSEAVGELTMTAVIHLPAMLGFLLGGILLVFALWRAGIVPVVAPILVLLGWVVPLVGFTPALFAVGGTLLVAGYLVVAVRLFAPAIVRRETAETAPASA
jgi:hypothetical protein